MPYLYPVPVEPDPLQSLYLAIILLAGLPLFSPTLLSRPWQILFTVVAVPLYCLAAFLDLIFIAQALFAMTTVKICGAFVATAFIGMSLWLYGNAFPIQTRRQVS